MELHFTDPDEPYRLAAELRERLDGPTFYGVELVPTADGPALRIPDELVADPRVQELLGGSHSLVTT